jgi:isocitrate dehydrogenase (NAD+)
MPHAVTVLCGDGKGPEFAAGARRVLDASGAAFEWVEVEAGAGALEAAGTPLPERALGALKETRVALQAPMGPAASRGPRAIQPLLRHALGLHTEVWFCKSLNGVPGHVPDVDLVFFREASEGLHAGIEYGRGDERASRLIELVAELGGPVLSPEVGVAVRPISRAASERVVEAAYEYALASGRKKLTVVHASAAWPRTDGFFQHTARNVAVRYPDVAFEDGRLEELCVRLVAHPDEFDVLVTPDLYGDVLAGAAAARVGGLAPCVRLGAEGAAVFTGGPGAGRDPCAMLAAGVRLLAHVGEADAARRVESALAAAVQSGADEPVEAVLRAL